MDFHYNQGYKCPVNDTYEKVLDVKSGDQMLFWHQDGVELFWSFLPLSLNSVKPEKIAKRCC